MIAEATEKKYCPCCGETKAVAMFGRDYSKHDGLSVYCKPCRKAKSKTPEYRNMPSRSSRWADGMFRSLHLTGRDY